MTQLQLEFWSIILSAISTFMVVIVAFAGAIKYLQERRRDREVRQEELAWRKTQFILELADDFEKDAQYQTVKRLLSYGVGLPKNSALDRILGNNTNILNKSEMKLRYAIDDYLDFFDRLYHFTFVTRSLSIPEIEVFGWYIAQIGDTKEICDYANSAGFEDVIRLSLEIQKLFEKKDWYQIVNNHPAAHRNDKTGKVYAGAKSKSKK